ncbi:MAG: MATE family efflux transporter, partial [Pseudoflavonifractor sp.]
VICRALQACGDIKFPTAICVISAWGVGVGGSILFGGVLGYGLAGLWGAMAADECIRAVLFLWRWHGKTWSRKHLIGI